ncbi:LOW QUALITY PROTEIN: 5-hydroxytryptamine receptor 1B [Cololabis saira]|uniref:LOW QUALITY PROTEIN: 5-hydroxytryptamine receptor 1B n=1 Tax=Cololabis saira TaxID=129043 RepID=UPI002AD42592|nr:LOW QUALITY PROTEIN: 5-hydroxytryptamine receptor 1B [Cololabis saira]
MDAEELIESIIIALMFIAWILGNNWLATVSLPRQKSGICTNKILFINLAISNLITNYLVDLPDTMANFAGRWFLGETLCGIFRFCADLSETSSIFTTFFGPAFISAFWHQKLVGSLQCGGAPVQLDSLLTGSWTMAVVFSIPHFFSVSMRHQTSNDSHEDSIDVFPNVLTQQTYEIIYSTVANAFPPAGIIFASVQIVVTLLQNQRRIGNHNSYPANELVIGNKTGNRSISIVSSPGTSKELKDPLSQVSKGQPTSSMLNVGLAGESPLRDSSQGSKERGGCDRVVLVCWLTHMVLHIANSIHISSIIVEVASYFAAS